MIFEKFLQIIRHSSIRHDWISSLFQDGKKLFLYRIKEIHNMHWRLSRFFLFFSHQLNPIESISQKDFKILLCPFRLLQKPFKMLYFLEFFSIIALFARKNFKIVHNFL